MITETSRAAIQEEDRLTELRPIAKQNEHDPTIVTASIVAKANDLR